MTAKLKTMKPTEVANVINEHSPDKIIIKGYGIVHRFSVIDVYEDKGAKVKTVILEIDL